MGARGFDAALRLYGAFAGRRVAVIGGGALASDVAAAARAAGLAVVAEVREPGPLRIEGALEVEGLAWAGGQAACDTVVLAIDVVPNLELPDVLGCAIGWDAARGGFVARDGPLVRLVGDAAGTAPAGRAAWMAAALAEPGAMVCACEEVMAADLRALRPPRYLGAEGPGAGLEALGALNQDQVKRLTRAGMGACQGRRCRDAVQALLGAVGHASHRAPLRPLPLAVLAALEEDPALRANLDRLVRHRRAMAAALGAGAGQPGVHRRAADGGGRQVIVIIGGGVTGLSTAFWLAREGHAVTVVEKGIVGWEASGRNGGGCTHPYSPLFREEQRLWPMMDELLGHPTEWRPNRIKVALDEGQLDRVWKSTVLATDQGFAAEALDPAQLRALCPWVGPQAVGGVFWRYGGHANPQRTSQAYAWAVERHGGRVLQHTTVTGIRTVGGKAVAVETSAGEIGCDAVVLAAGPHTARLAERFGQRIPVAPARAEMIVTEPLPPIAAWRHRRQRACTGGRPCGATSPMAAGRMSGWTWRAMRRRAR